jgi:hypothetical protein
MPSPIEQHSIILRLARQELMPRQAIDHLVSAGAPLAVARRRVRKFLGWSPRTIGGDDASRYTHSGRLVSTVAAEWEGGARAPLPSEVQRVNFFVVSGKKTTRLKRLASLFFSDERGLFCTWPGLRWNFDTFPIIRGNDGKQLTPTDGREFFDAQIWQTGSYSPISDPQLVDAGRIYGHRFDPARGVWVDVGLADD